MQIWTDEKIKDAITEMVASTGQRTFPTHSEIYQYFGNYKLSNAIRRHGGSEKWSRLTGLPEKDCESYLGKLYEKKFIDMMAGKNIKAEKMEIGYPYDVLVDGFVKVDVKVSHLYKQGDFGFYSCNIEKPKQTCDLYVVYCIDDNKSEKVYVIPSNILKGATQLSIGKFKSKYDRYLGQWSLIDKYIRFSKEIR